MTAYYMFRMVTLTFLGSPRWAEGKHPHESPWTMTMPLVVLAVLAVVGGFLGVPAILGGGNAIEQWLSPVFSRAEALLHHPHEHSHALEYGLMAVSVAIAVFGFVMGRRIFLANPNADETFAAKAGGVFRTLNRKYFIDEGYAAAIVNPLVRVSDRVLARIVDNGIIDGIVNATAGITGIFSAALRYAQTGIVQSYATMVVLGILVVLSIMLFG
jgi:NADH-quinone oxidoreductase subunit L